MEEQVSDSPSTQHKILDIFKFENHDIRIIPEPNDKNEIQLWFCSSDVCKVLSMSNNCIQRIDKDLKGSRKVATLGGVQTLSFLSEYGLYLLVLRSNKPLAKPFIDWIIKEVIPSIRKLGKYEVKSKDDLPQILNDITELETKLKEKDDIIKKKDMELTETKSTLQKLQTTHNRLKKTRSYHKFKIGQCLYMLHNPECSDENKHKIGITNNINRRLKEHRTDVPYYKLKYLIYIQTEKMAVFLETSLKLRFESDLPNNEIIVNTKLEDIINHIRQQAQTCNIPYTEDPNIEKYNQMLDEMRKQPQIEEELEPSVSNLSDEPEEDANEEKTVEIKPQLSPEEIKHKEKLERHSYLTKKKRREKEPAKFQLRDQNKADLELGFRTCTNQSCLKRKTLNEFQKIIKTGRYSSWCCDCVNKLRSKNYKKTKATKPPKINKTKLGHEIQYEKDGVLSKTYMSAMELSRDLHISRHAIVNSIKTGEPYKGMKFICLSSHR